MGGQKNGARSTQVAVNPEGDAEKENTTKDWGRCTDQRVTSVHNTAQHPELRASVLYSALRPVYSIRTLTQLTWLTNWIAKLVGSVLTGCQTTDCEVWPLCQRSPRAGDEIDIAATSMLVRPRRVAARMANACIVLLFLNWGAS
jgi:hypothetical protein